MGVTRDISGQSFGRLTAIRRTGNDKYGHVTWLFKCSCGNETITVGSGVWRGKTKSCGCLTTESIVSRSTKHGCAKHNARTVEYQTWRSLKYRCRGDNCKDWASYKGKGIKVCSRWNKFENFLEDMGERPSKEHSIDRIDNDGDYCPENCRWADDATQANNKSTNVVYTLEGRDWTVAQLAIEHGMKYTTLSQRLGKLKWPLEKALTTPVRNRR